MEESTIYRVHITLSSSLDGETTNNNHIGEYRIKNGFHTIVYTDRAGNMITKVGTLISEIQTMILSENQIKM